MITPIDLHAAHAIGFAVDGSVSDADLDTIAEEIDAKAGDYQKLRLYVELRRFPDFDGVRTLLRGLRAKTVHFGKIEKYALVTDSSWIKPLATAADYLVSTIDFKTFTAGNAEVAQAWLLNDTPAPEHTSAISEVAHFADPNVVAIAVSGKLHKADYDRINLILTSHANAHSLLLEIREITGLSLKAIMDELKSDVDVWDRFEKVAVVGHTGWLPAATRVADWFTPNLDVRYFDVTDVAGARLWLGVRKNVGTDVAPR